VLEIVSRSPEETRRLGQELGRLALPGDVLLLTGQLGAGKTCLTQGIAWGLGVEGYATSPTFVVVNQYSGRLTMYHVDLYRIDTLSEAVDLGLDDYLYGDGICVVEWADKALEALPPEHLLVEMGFVSDTSRSITFKPSGSRYRALLTQFDREISKAR